VVMYAAPTAPEGPAADVRFKLDAGAVAAVPS
jgi:hypothetical protein